MIFSLFLAVDAYSKKTAKTLWFCHVSYSILAKTISDEFDLLVGTLDSVVNLTIESDSNSVRLHWEAPWSLNVTGVEPDIWYTVLIHNVTNEGENPPLISCDDCHNLTESHYTFTPHNPSPCHKYNFTVLPQNGAGDGENQGAISGFGECIIISY